ncbi:MAG TPA: YceI family protein [Terricaulis sp.]|nr:YceI family protein [Terricaulis sp.]HRP11026.1 YceI family protein [Terricaulis sp.]
MKTLTIAAAAAALALAACTPATAPSAPAEAAIPITAPSGEYSIDSTHAVVTVKVRHFGVSTYPLRFDRTAGTLNFNAEDPALSTVTATVDISSLNTAFNQLAADARGDRDFNAELVNSDWLDAAQFPAATFTSTSAERTGPNTGRVTGDLTIKGVTHPATFDVTYIGSHAQHPVGAPISLIGFRANATISRSAYGVSLYPETGAGSGDGLGDNVELEINVEFTRPIQAEQ